MTSEPADTIWANSGDSHVMEPPDLFDISRRTCGSGCHAA